MPTPTPMKPDDGAEKYYLVKHGLYYRPNACGYTANVSEAGHFDYKYAMSDVRATAGEKDKNDRVQMIPVPTTPTPDRATELAQWLLALAKFHRETQPYAHSIGQLEGAADELLRLAQVEAAAGELAAPEDDEDAFNNWNRDVTDYLPSLWDAYIAGLNRGRSTRSAQPTPGKAGA